MLFLRVAVFILGLAVIVGTLFSAIETFVLPRSANDPLTRFVFLTIRRIFDLNTRRARSYQQRDRAMAFYAPLALLALPPVWLTLVALGYSGLFWSLGGSSWGDAFMLSGSSLLTLGFAAVPGFLHGVVSFSEAAIGLILVALFIAYLPAMYSAFQRREAAVTMLEVRAGSPPSAVEMIERFHRIHGLNRLGDQWATWEAWFADIEESHTSLAALVFFRSPQPNHSWVTAAGAILDAASLAASTLDIPRDPRADLCIRAGYLALRHIAAFFFIPFDQNPVSSDAISVARQEFDAVCERLAAAGIPLKPDRDQAWRDFAGWRINYDTVLLALAGLTMAPYAPWSSDRSIWRPPRNKRGFLQQPPAI